jgi:transcriptional regulator with XRE-family HTH domain
MDYQQFFLENIICIMTQKEMTKQDLSRATKLSPSLIKSYFNAEGGKPNLTLKTMITIAEALETPLDILTMDPNGPYWKYIKTFAAFNKLTYIDYALNDNKIKINAVVNKLQAYRIKEMLIGPRTKKNL